MTRIVLAYECRRNSVHLYFIFPELIKYRENIGIVKSLAVKQLSGEKLGAGNSSKNIKSNSNKGLFHGGRYLNGSYQLLCKSFGGIITETQVQKNFFSFVIHFAHMDVKRPFSNSSGNDR